MAAGVLLLLSLGVQARPSEAAGSPAAPSPASLGKLVSLPGSLVPGLWRARRVEVLPSSRTLSVEVALKVQDEAGLQQLLHSIYSPGSALYHHYLTVEQFRARFAPAGRDQQQVVDWLHSQGLRVTQRSRNGLMVTAAGSVGRLEAAFGTRVYGYQHGRQRFFANAKPIHVPQGLAQQIVAVTGLDSIARHHRLGRIGRARPHGPTRDNGLPGLSPAFLADFYNIKPVWDAGYTGSGQAIALVEVTDVSDDNLNTFNDQFGLPHGIVRIPVSAGNKKGGSSINPGEQLEAEMDIEVAHEAAPAASLLVYEGPDTSDKSSLAIYNQIVSDNRAQVISTSYGLAESGESRASMVATDQILEEAAAQGQSFLASSGDQGAYDAAKQKDDPKHNTLQVDYPASDPWATGVGGTIIFQQNDGSYNERTWSDRRDTPPSGSGGGLSTVWKRPWYQSGPGVASHYSNGMRQVPDVSALAGDPGYSMYTIRDDQKGFEWQAGTGTSASTPFWAGYVALVNQALQQPIGFLNPTLYALGQKAGTFQTSPFFDVTAGDNLYYPATPGWDFATGWGSMNADAFIKDTTSMGGPQLVRPTDWLMKVSVTKPNKKFVRLSQVKRGQSVYFVTNFTVIALPSTQTAAFDFTFSSPKRSIFHSTDSFQVDKSYVRKSGYDWMSFKIPKGAPKGTYTLTVKMTVGSEAKQASTRVKVQ